MSIIIIETPRVCNRALLYDHIEDNNKKLLFLVITYELC